jgi:hypothetical protein
LAWYVVSDSPESVTTVCPSVPDADPMALIQEDPAAAAECSPGLITQWLRAD